MKPWIKRSLIGLTSVTVLLGGLTACGARGHHGEGWSAERVSEVRGKVIGKISGKLDLDEAQKLKLGDLADQIIASRTAFRGESANPPAVMTTLIERLPWLSAIPAYFVGVGVRPERAPAFARR